MPTVSAHFRPPCLRNANVTVNIVTLFLIYINDLPEICAEEDPSSEIFLYADDSKIYKVIRNQSDQQKLQTIGY